MEGPLGPLSPEEDMDGGQPWPGLGATVMFMLLFGLEVSAVQLSVKGLLLSVLSFRLAFIFCIMFQVHVCMHGLGLWSFSTLPLDFYVKLTILGYENCLHLWIDNWLKKKKRAGINRLFSWGEELNPTTGFGLSFLSRHPGGRFQVKMLPSSGNPSTISWQWFQNGVSYARKHFRSPHPTATLGKESEQIQIHMNIHIARRFWD